MPIKEAPCSHHLPSPWPLAESTESDQTERHHQCRRPRHDLDRWPKRTDPSVGAQAFGDRSDRVPHSQQCSHRSRRRAAHIPVMIMNDSIKYPHIRVRLKPGRMATRSRSSAAYACGWGACVPGLGGQGVQW